jgi:exodeoxyribonuclease VII small subunit
MREHLQRLKSAFCYFSMPKTIPIPASGENITYEAALQELEGLVQRMESGQIPLDELLTGYQRGAMLLKICRDKLAAVEQQVKQLDGKAVQE